jgi:3-isopropylmalate dehydrogenase
MALLTRPRDFDVILTPNLFGDILSDIASVLTGSIGLPGSALLSTSGTALYEPGHGSAFDIAGQDRANPVAAIRCVALMLTHTFDRPDLAAAVERSVARVLGQGLRTADIYRGGGRQVGTTAMGDAVVRALEEELT